MTETGDTRAPWRDPIVVEVRRVREKLFAEAGYDIREFCRRLREERATSGHHVVTRAPGNRPDRPGEAA